ncbi:hypothetical protein [Alicyclobacillus tolerans]|uniref:TadE-like protein n=1 Tax=Alicyclobacillus tolerans TaxID=90970 RepID=A0A1M6Y8A8_9BACL|nr:hypothetical protein [Alicyclobacillus montanus]SHL14514.1 hypothetical protein SAMN05443507_1451 [Alicyclobacillus montanus]
MRNRRFWRYRVGYTALASLYTELINTTLGVVVLGLMLTVGAALMVRQELLNAAFSAAQIAAETQNIGEAQAAAEDTLIAEGLPATVNGETLFQLSDVAVTTGNSAPVAGVEMTYQFPLPFPRLEDVFGNPNPLPATWTLSVQAAYVNQTYYGGGGA